MSVDTHVRKSVERLRRTRSRRFPVPPMALVTGPPWCNGSTPAFGAVQFRFES